MSGKLKTCVAGLAAVIAILIFLVFVRAILDKKEVAKLPLLSEGVSLVSMSGSLFLCESDAEGLKDGDRVKVEFVHYETGETKWAVFTLTGLRRSSLPVDTTVHPPDIPRGYLGTEEGPSPRESIAYNATVEEKNEALRYKGDTWGIRSVQKIN